MATSRGTGGYSPTAFTAYNWKGAPPYTRGDIPSAWMDTNVDRNILAQQFAYEWLDSSGSHAGARNPPFLSQAGGVLFDSQRDLAVAPRILRGFIRRAEFNKSDPVSQARLYFMYNPEQITRDYVSYLDQGALDPFNTVFDSGNLVAPPSFMDFSFTLFFDRQEEAAKRDNPGVLVDYEYFDLVVRNVIPTGRTQPTNALPDNGVMMVNPRDITVVFSPEITIQGRPLNARVAFTKFTHRMTPVRMEIALTMRVVYIGPVREMIEYKAEETKAEEAIPWDERKVEKFTLKFRDLDAFFSALDIEGLLKKSIMDELSNLSKGNSEEAKKALDWAKKTVSDNHTKWSSAKPHNFPGKVNDSTVDASGLVWRSFREIKQDTEIGWPEWASASAMIQTWENNGWKTGYRIFLSPNWTKDSAVIAQNKKKLYEMKYGDLLFSYQMAGYMTSVSFFMELADDKVKVFESNAGGWVGEKTYSVDDIMKRFNYGVRPGNVAADGATGEGDRQGNVPDLSGSGVIPQSACEAVPTGQGSHVVYLHPTAAAAFKKWRDDFGEALVCYPDGGGWRSTTQADQMHNANPGGAAPGSKSWHCKGLAIDLDPTWIGNLDRSDPVRATRLRVAARNAGWGQYAWREAAGQVPGFEAGCNCQNGTNHKENWHFSFGGCS